MNNKIDYAFECINLTDYELKIALNVDNSLLTSLFNKAREEFVKNKKIDASKLGDPKIFDRFEADKRYLNTIKTALGRTIKNIFKEVNKDQISILNCKAEKCIFQRGKFNREVWQVIFTCSGQYADKR
jgi:hypothetical protein